jgi:hypothetical protein
MCHLAEFPSSLGQFNADFPTKLGPLSDGLDMTHPSKTLDIVALGEAMVAFNPSLGPAPDEPPMSLQGFGGDNSKTTIAAARLAAHVSSLTRLGTDLRGERLMTFSLAASSTPVGGAPLARKCPLR